MRKTFLNMFCQVTGKSKGHQGGLYIPKQGARLMFEIPCKKGEKREKFVTIEWYDGVIVENCRFVFYGEKTRNEFRITCLNRKFNVGDFVIMVKLKDDYYMNFLIREEQEIKSFYKKLTEGNQHDGK